MTNTISVHDSSIENLKKELYDSLCTGILDSMVHGNATFQDGKESARFILDNLEKVSTKKELLQFLFDLTTKWKLYNPYYVKIKYVFEQQDDTKKIEDLKSKLYTFIQPS